MTQLLLKLFGALPSRKAPPPVRVSEPATATAGELEKRARQLLTDLGCKRLARLVRVQWNPRMRSTAGTASYATSTITLNPRLAEFGEAEIDVTLRHELAHLLAKFRAGKRRIKPHGAEWQLACHDLGIAREKRCHSLPLPRRQLARRHLYRCLHCQTDVPRVRPFRRKVACLSCCRAHNGGRYDERFRLVKAR